VGAFPIIRPTPGTASHNCASNVTLHARWPRSIDIVNAEGRTTKTATWEIGKACWRDADPPGEPHGDINRGAAPIEVVAVERRR
jgi:hypothetical protein